MTIVRISLSRVGMGLWMRNVAPVGRLECVCWQWHHAREVTVTKWSIPCIQTLLFARTFADKRSPTETSPPDKAASKKRVDKVVNEELQKTFGSEDEEQTSSAASGGQKRGGSDKGSERTDFALRDKTPKSDWRQSVQGRPDPVRMQKMEHPEEASTDTGGYLKLEDIGFSDDFVDKKMSEEQRADDRIRKFNPNDTARRNELPYDMLKRTPKAEKDMSEKKEGASEKKDPENTKQEGNSTGRRSENKMEESRRRNDDDRDVDSDRENDRRADKSEDRGASLSRERRSNDGCDDEGSDSRKPTRNRGSDDDNDDGNRKKSGKQVADERERERREDGKKNERRSERRSQAQSVLWEGSRTPASSDSSGMGQLTEQLMDRDQADKRVEKTDLSEGEKWKEGAREEGVPVEDIKDGSNGKRKPRK